MSLSQLANNESQANKLEISNLLTRFLHLHRISTTTIYMYYP